MSDPAIEVVGLSKMYRLYAHPTQRLKEALHPWKKKYHREFWALRDVSFEVKQGETVGVIGRNGSGKSTAMQLICGTLFPTSGRISARGRIAALLELGAGFNPEFTGRENVHLQGAIMGYSRSEMRRRMSEVEEFADIGEFFDQPVKTYSSGMFVRVAFAAAMTVDPEILVIDEALAVGDAAFQRKCMLRISRFRQEGRTVLFVSHDLGALKALCDSVAYLKQGVLVEFGRAGDVIDRYVLEMSPATTSGQPSESTESGSVAGQVSRVASKMTIDRRSIVSFNKTKFFERSGDGAARTLLVSLLDDSGRSVTVAEFGQMVTLRVLVEASTYCPRLTVAFYVKDRTRLDIIGTNSDYEKQPVIGVRAGDRFLYQFRFALRIKQGDYSITIVLAEGTEDAGRRRYFDWIEDAISFEVRRPGHTLYALYAPPVDLKIEYNPQIID